MGSTKNTIAIREASVNKTGIGEFDFRDDWGAFDYTHADSFEMPDTIRGKGAAECMKAAVMSEEMIKRGVPNHYLGLVDENGNLISVHDARKPVKRMRFKLVRVLHPEPIMGQKEGKEVIVDYDYSAFKEAQQRGEGVLVAPLEFIYRECLPEGSSMLSKFRDGRLNPKDYGFDGVPEPYTMFPATVFDPTTKFEKYDRAVTWEYVVKSMGIGQKELDVMRGLAKSGVDVISDIYRMIDMTNADGKFEFVFGPKREIEFGDVVGALDEIRGLYNHNGVWVQISKEPGRQYYKITQPEWVEECEKLKKAGIPNWQEQCKHKPKPLDPVFRELFEFQYLAPTNAMLGKDIFPGVPPLQEVVAEMHKYMTMLKAQHQRN